MALGQSLGVYDSGGRRGRGRGKVPQGAVLLDHAAVLARSVRSLDNVRSLLNFTRCILHSDIFVSVCCGALATGGSCERVLAVADWCAGVCGGVSVGTERVVPSIAQGHRVATCIAQGHGPLPEGLARTPSLL